MQFLLRDSLRFCIVGGSVILLDLAAGRYIGLSQLHGPAFERWAAGSPLSESDLDILGALVGQGLLVAGDAGSVPALSSVASVAEPETLIATRGLRPGLRSILAAICARVLWRWRVRVWPLQRLVGRIERMSLAVDSGTGAASASSMAKTVRCFEIADLVLGSHDLCLVRSLALAAACRKRGLPAALVIAVRPAPFVAHCWVQHRGVLLNEHPDRARLYTPILVA